MNTLMHRSVCGIMPVLREKGAVGFGSLKQSCSESRSSVRSPCGFVVFASSFWWLGRGAREGSPVSARIARSATRSSHRHPLAGGEVVVANRNPWRPIMALTPLGTSSPNDEPTPLNLHDVYRTHAGCGYTRSLTLAPIQVQQLTARLRGINAIVGVLIAGNDTEVLHLGDWLRSGLVEAISSLSLDAANDIDRANEHAAKTAKGAAA